MIARLVLHLPFDVIVPEGAQFRVMGYEEDGYLVKEYPPVNIDQPPHGFIPEKMTLDGVDAFVANGLKIDFHKGAFDRTAGPSFDPPEPVMRRCVERLLNRIRFVTAASQILVHALRRVSWRVQYLNDDQSELEPAEGLVRARWKRAATLSIVGLTPSVWDEIIDLGPAFEPPPWDTLLLDALALMPSVGTAVTLTATALEVFIANVLDRLATHAGVPEDVWTWINNRGFAKGPSTEEQFDQLLRIVSGRSLKDSPIHWDAFKNVRTARNSFVHQGTATIGKVAVTEQTAAELISRAQESIKLIRNWMPEPLRWPEPKITSVMEFTQNVTTLVGGKTA